MNRLGSAWLVCFVFATWASGKEHYVSPEGDDLNPGSKLRPFRTIQRATRAVEPGDVCYVREGTYRESIRPAKGGESGRQVRFAAYPGEAVTLSGADILRGTWSVYKGHIYRTKVNFDFEQLFLDGTMVVEARWPNMRLDQLWDRTRWAAASKGSRYGKMVDPELARTGVDWTGALATLNVAHQFLTWTRLVRKYGGDTFEYDRDLPSITDYANKTAEWEDDRYYLSGKLEALDAPGEWYLNRTDHALYLWTPDGTDPSSHTVEAKVRDYAFEVSGLNYVELSGFHFFAATFRFNDSNHGVVDGCNLLFPTYARELTDLAASPKPVTQTLMSGSHNVIRNCSLAYSSTGGFEATGSANTIENNIVHDVSWNGSLRYVGIDSAVTESGENAAPSVIRRNTVFRTGNAGINFHGRHIVEYNHVYSGGLACKDVALIYTALPPVSGSIVRYNWAHGCHTEGGHGGLGIRGDDQTRGLTVHHNVVWDTGRAGIIVKGDGTEVFNNTVLRIGDGDWVGNYISLHTEPEPEKPWRKQWPLLKVQNAHSDIFNNVARTITCDRKLTPFPPGENVAGNYMGADAMLVDPSAMDFRPAPGSPLIGAGRVIPGFTNGYQGKGPDIGAYEYGGERWVPGHRNRIRVWPESVTANPSGEAGFDFAFVMPLLEPAVVWVQAAGDAVVAAGNDPMRIPESEWMRRRRVNVRLRGASGSIRLESPGVDMVQIEIHK